MRMMRHCSLEHFQGVATIVFYDVSCELKRPILGASYRIDLVQRGSPTATNVRFGPKADINRLHSITSSAAKECHLVW
jgi:hypothetical protein